MKNVHDKYKMIVHRVNYQDIQEVIFRLTEYRLEKDFGKYVYEDVKTPVHKYIVVYKNNFNQLSDTLINYPDSNHNGYINLLFINIEMTL